MSEATQDAVPAEEEAAPAPSRNWKMIGVIAGGSVAFIGIVVGVVAVIASPGKPPMPEKAQGAKAPHEVSIAPGVAAPVPAAKPAAPEKTIDDKELLEKQIQALEQHRRTLLRQQAELVRQQKEMIARQQGLSGEKQCQLSGDPVKRKEELRACFGLASLTASAPLASAATASGQAGKGAMPSAAALPNTQKSVAKSPPASPAKAEAKPPTPGHDGHH